MLFIYLNLMIINQYFDKFLFFIIMIDNLK